VTDAPSHRQVHGADAELCAASRTAIRPASPSSTTDTAPAYSWQAGVRGPGIRRGRGAGGLLAVWRNPRRFRPGPRRLRDLAADAGAPPRCRRVRREAAQRRRTVPGVDEVTDRSCRPARRDVQALLGVVGGQGTGGARVLPDEQREVIRWPTSAATPVRGVRADRVRSAPSSRGPSPHQTAARLLSSLPRRRDGGDGVLDGGKMNTAEGRARGNGVSNEDWPSAVLRSTARSSWPSPPPCFTLCPVHTSVARPRRPRAATTAASAALMPAKVRD